MGGIGAIYRAEHLHMHNQVAIKVLHPQAETLPELVARFEREAVAGAHIHHPNVACATAYAFFDASASPPARSASFRARSASSRASRSIKYRRAWCSARA